MQFGQINIEYRISILFSGIALILSIATGFISGIAAGTVFFRAVIIFVVFFGVGFAMAQVVKRFVPEVYEALSVQAEKSSGENVEETGTGTTVETVDGEDEPLEQSSGDEFREFTEKDYERYHTSEDAGLQTALNPSSGKMGKHVVVQQQFNNYEPKIMAQAIRTMMSKDKD